MTDAPEPVVVDGARAALARLESLLADLGSVVVAFSGGIDSAFLAVVASRTLGARALAVTGDSASYPEHHRRQALGVARDFGLRHEIVPTSELDRPGYRANAGDRCFHCKTELYEQIANRLPELGVAAIVSGANLDDLGDYRPGLQAAANHAVRHPLADCGIDKAMVRELAAHWNLPVWDKPASPCLSSRVAYGEEVTPERLTMIDAAEQYLRQQLSVTCRVRYHKGDIARIEVPLAQLAALTSAPLRENLSQHFRTLGFKFITLDLEGFRSGSLNQLVQISS